MKKNFIITLILFTIALHVHAANLSLVQTKDVYTGLVVFDVVLDPEGEMVNAFSGKIRIPRDMFDVESIATTDTVASLWLVSPRVAESDFLSSFVPLTDIEFEGALPGGFDGVRSPYYRGSRPGTIFHFTLRPKMKGTATLTLSDVKVLLNDGHATPALVTTNTATIVVPDLKRLPKVPKLAQTPLQDMKQAPETTLDAYLTRSDAVSSEKWALIISDDASRHTVVKYRVAESNTAIVRDVPFFEWRDAVSPYILAYQERKRFIHVEALYADGTYSVVTLPPVENTSDEAVLWRILITISIGMLAVYALHKLNAFRSFVGRS